VSGQEPRLGVVLLHGDHVVETLGLADPWSAPPPAGLPPGFFGHRDFWPVPTVYTVARAATGSAVLAGEPAAIRDVVAAVERLDASGQCQLIVGSCGYFHAAHESLCTATPVLLSGLDLLPLAMAGSARPVGILTYSAAATGELLRDHPDRDRLRVVGVDDRTNWAAISAADWITDPKWTIEGLRAELLDVVRYEVAHGRYTDVGSVVLECTVMPQFRSDLIGALARPVWDVAAVARTLLGT
jgi:hypothetical protein